MKGNGQVACNVGCGIFVHENSVVVASHMNEQNKLWLARTMETWCSTEHCKISHCVSQLVSKLRQDRHYFSSHICL